MKKPTIIAAAVLVVLVALFFVMQGGSEKPQSAPAYVIPAMPGLDRIEIAGKEEIVLVKKGDQWRIASPLDYPVASTFAKELDEAFKGGIETDLSLGKADPLKYGLGPEAAQIKLFEGGQEKASFRVGKDVTVKQTFAKRSFIQPAGSDEILRAQAGLQGLLVRELGSWRERRVLDFPEAGVTKLELRYSGKVVTLEGKADDKGELTWTSSEGFAVDEQSVKAFLGALSRLRADDFAPQDKPAAELGLAEPLATYTITLKDGVKTLLLGQKQGEEQYVQLQGEPWVYKINASTQSALDRRMGHFRPKNVLALDKSKVQELRLQPEDAEGPITLKKEGAAWVISAPTLEPNVDQEIVEALLRSVDGLTAQYMAEKELSVEAAGLAPGKAREVVLVLEGGTTTTLRLGASVGNQGDVYAQVEQGEVFVLAGFKAQKLNPRIASLVRKG